MYLLYPFSLEMCIFELTVQNRNLLTALQKTDWSVLQIMDGLVRFSKTETEPQVS